MSSKARALRIQQVIEYLQDNTAGAREISVALGIPYITMTRLLPEMEEVGRIKLVGYKHGSGGNLYTADRSDEMPLLSSFGTNLPAIDFVKQFFERARVSGGRFQSDGISDSVHYLAMALSTVLYEAERAYSYGQVNEKNLRDTRETLIKVVRTFTDMAKLGQQILDVEEFWHVETLGVIPKSKHWDSVIVKNAYDTLTLKDG